MIDPRTITIEDYTYELPQERIAKFPLAERDQSKLLLWHNGALAGQTTFVNLPEHLPKDALLVFNNSKVVESRLLFQKPTGGLIEIFALEPHESIDDITQAMGKTEGILYKCMVGGISKWKAGIVLKKSVETNEGTVTIEASLMEKRTDGFIISFSWNPKELTFADILHYLGQMPIPPYLQREAEETDSERYQTVYAEKDGSVAAPTAGLHFTPAVLKMLLEKGIQQVFTTLHVGAGTFMPVKSETMEGHQMHAEFLEVSFQTIQKLLTAKTIIPVGTTSMRTLESLYQMGVKALKNPEITMQQLEIQQWEAYEWGFQQPISKQDALNSLLTWLEKRKIAKLVIRTQIIIAPGYQFGVCKGLVTNFHQPKSTLLLLIAAITGSKWKEIYQYALENDFRFLSYGDSSLLLM
jgi:S-adenosylmethionine:tRNA ribosyltransferase-isomerase